MTSCRTFPLIRQVRAYVTDSTKASQGADCHDVTDQHWINGYPTPIACPMSVYPRYRAYRKSWGINVLGTAVVEVEASDGTTGVGVTVGGEPACYIVEYHLSRFLEGQDPRNIELMWDQMYRATLNYGRKGLSMQAISAVDLALWDLLGKLRNEPIYNLLGGKCVNKLPFYCTGSRPDIAKELGFVGAKIPCPHGPSEGDEGLKKNIEFVRSWREKVGEDFPISLDCYMGLTVKYSIKLARALLPYKIKWMEEHLSPDDYTGYKEVRQALLHEPIMLTTGEHEFTRYGFRELVGAADIFQPDITWVGGITEARRIVALAAAHNILVIPHGSSVYSYHLQYAYPNCPVAEYMNLSADCKEIVPYFGSLFIDEPLPINGVIELDPSKPGFGVTLNRGCLRRPYSRSSNSDVFLSSDTVEKPCMPF